MLSIALVYKKDGGGLCIVMPSTECQSIEELEKSDINCKEYKIIKISDIPSDRTFRDAWELSDD